MLVFNVRKFPCTQLNKTFSFNFSKQNNLTLGQVTLDLEPRRIHKRDYRIFLSGQGKSLKHVAEESLNGSPERSFQDVQGKPGLHWKSQGVGHARAVGWLLQSTTNQAWNQLKREKHAVAKETRNGVFDEHFNIRYRDT